MRNPTKTINPLVKIGKSILDGIINAFSFIFPTIADDMNISEASKSVVNSKETSMQYEGYDLSQSDEQSINSFIWNDSHGYEYELFQSDDDPSTNISGMINEHEVVRSLLDGVSQKIYDKYCRRRRQTS
jgi:hypothetical protein